MTRPRVRRRCCRSGWGRVGQRCVSGTLLAVRGRGGGCVASSRSHGGTPWDACCRRLRHHAASCRSAGTLIMVSCAAGPQGLTSAAARLFLLQRIQGKRSDLYRPGNRGHRSALQPAPRSLGGALSARRRQDRAADTDGASDRALAATQSLGSSPGAGTPPWRRGGPRARQRWDSACEPSLTGSVAVSPAPGRSCHFPGCGRPSMSASASRRRVR